MDYARLLPDEHLLPLIQGLVPEDLARVAVLMSDLVYAMTNSDRAAADQILNCVASQINDYLDDEDAEEFRTLLEKAAGPDA